MIVIQNALIDAAQDEVVFTAQYSFTRLSVILGIYWLLMWRWLGFTYDVAHHICEGIVSGEGLLHFLLLGSILLLLLTPVLGFGLNPLLFKEFIFYPNRLGIVRRIFRSKTVYHSNAVVEKGTLTAGHLIYEAREKGKPQQTPFFYDIYTSFFSSEAREEIENIFDYLTDDSSQKNPRIFKRRMLPLDVLLKRSIRP
jgi:hypothetical protein